MPHPVIHAEIRSQDPDATRKFFADLFVEEVLLAAQAGAKSIGEKVLHNTAVNTEAAFDAAQAIVRAKTIPEAARLQADFVQQQLAVAGAQTKELLELSTKVAKQTFEFYNAAATKSFEQMKKAG